jgi:hypothetical protein
MTDDKITFHIDAATKRKDLPDMGSHEVCPTCHGPLQTGFGLAGGGFGVYTYCEACARVTSKSEVDE